MCTTRLQPCSGSNIPSAHDCPAVSCSRYSPSLSQTHTHTHTHRYNAHTHTLFCNFCLQPTVRSTHTDVPEQQCMHTHIHTEYVNHPSYSMQSDSHRLSCSSPEGPKPGIGGHKHTHTHAFTPSILSSCPPAVTQTQLAYLSALGMKSPTSTERRDISSGSSADPRRRPCAQDICPSFYLRSDRKKDSSTGQVAPRA